MDIASSRRSYDRGALDESVLLPDPIAQLRCWIDEAAASGVLEPGAMALSSAAADGSPSCRMVLLRGLDERGLVFFSGYGSRKGREVARRPQVAALFYWPGCERQVRVEGRAEQLGEDESDAYFASRPRGHQLGAWASEQSEPIETRDLLDARLSDYATRFEDEAVPRPHSWGGYLIRPDRFEFWQGRPNRMHDRILMVREGGAWQIGRLQP